MAPIEQVADGVVLSPATSLLPAAQLLGQFPPSVQGRKSSFRQGSTED